SLIPSPPTSILFPYTTLFRSHKTRPVDILNKITGLLPPGNVGIELIGGEIDHPGQTKLRGRGNGVGPEKTVYSRTEGAVQVMFQDRKSTRLNSSHVKISYAVF